MSFPGSNPISRELDDFWKESQALWQQWWFEADLDTKMATGQQDYFNNTFYNVNYRNQKLLQFNKILRIINMMGGYQRKNRLASVAYPADNDPDDGERSDEMTKVLNWVKNRDCTYEKISDCFDNANMCGLNLLNIWMDFREDPENGEIRTSRIPFNAFLMDNYWTKPDLSDCDRIWTRRYVTTRQLESMFPSIKKDIPYLGKGYAAKDGKFQFLAQNWYQYQQEMYAYDEYWVREYRSQRKILDKNTGELIDWKGNKDQFQALRRFNPNVELITTQVPTVKWYVLVNNHVVYEEKSPYGLDRLPFVPYMCYHFPEVQNYAFRYQGVVRNIRDSQIELNRRKNRMLDILDAQVQSGIMVKEDALVNPEDAFMQGPGKVMYFKNTANLATDVAPFPAPPVAQGWQELIQSLDADIMSIVGTPEELFGENMNGQDQSGILLQLKMGAGLTSLQNVFDRLNMSQKMTAEIMLDLVQKNFSTGKVAQIIGKQPVENFSDYTTTKYQIVIEEASMTDTQRQLQFMQATYLKQMGIPISNAYLIKKSTLQGKKEILDDIQQQEQQAQALQQAQAQLQLENQQVLNRSLEAKAQSDFAGAEERKARAVADIGLAKERSSQAVHDRASAALDNAKAVKELQDMDQDGLERLARFIMDLQLHQKMLAGHEEGDSTESAKVVGSDVNQANQQSKPKKPQQ